MEKVEVVGTLSRLAIYGERWGRAFLTITPEQAAALGVFRPDSFFQGINITGAALVGLNEGTEYRMRGTIKDHPKYGRSLDAEAATIELDANPAALANFLRRNIQGVGEISAKKIVARYAKDDQLRELREILLNNPLSLDVGAVLGQKKSKMATLKGSADQGVEVFIHRDLALRLGADGVMDSTLRKIGVWLAVRLPNPTSPDAVARAWALFLDDPYRPMLDVSGYGFAQADLIGGRLGVPRNHPSRLAALAMHAITQGCEMYGHVFLDWHEFVDAIRLADGGIDAEAAVNAAATRGWPVQIEQGTRRVYTNKLHAAQQRLAGLLSKMAGREIPCLYGGMDVHADIRAAERRVVAPASAPPGTCFRLDDSQRIALCAILTSRSQIHTLTAGPGSGKTALMELLVDILGRSRVGVFCAPTGKAAKVLSARVAKYHLSAQTIHTTLGVTEEGFVHNEDNPIFGDFVVIDESSMIDVELAGSLLAAIPAKCHLIFLGDTNQLPSVGPGQVLADLRRLPFDHHRLSSTHRNDGGILATVNEAAAGAMTLMDYPDVKFSRGLPEASLDSVAPLLLEYERAVARHGIPAVALLCARRKGNPDTPGWNTTYLNKVLRDRMNPRGERIKGTGLFTGDRVVVRKNMRLVQQPAKDDKPATVEAVVNGDTGTVGDAHYGEKAHEPESVTVRFDDGRTVRFPTEAVGVLALAYAVTVHTSQGSEFAEVQFVCTNGMPSFIHRGIVFTALSRAKKMLRVYGENGVIQSIVRRPIPPRNSALVEMVSAATQALKNIEPAQTQAAHPIDLDW